MLLFLHDVFICLQNIVMTLARLGCEGKNKFNVHSVRRKGMICCQGSKILFLLH